MAKSKRYYPVQLKTRLADATATTADWRYLHAETILSGMNRRLARQSYVYSLKIDIDPGSTAAANGVEIYVLRDNWDTHGAYKMAMKHYYNAMKEELAAAPGAEGRWQDFKVGVGMQTDRLVGSTSELVSGAVPNMSPRRTYNVSPDISEVTDANGVTKQFLLTTASTGTSYSIFQEWSRSNQTGVDPSSQSITMPYGDIVENLDEANYDEIRNRGRSPPYPGDADDEQWVKVAVLGNNAAIDSKLSSGFFEAPLGIVVIKAVGTFVAGASSLDHPMTLTFQRGDYKGVKAHRYATPMLNDAKEWEVV